MGPRCSCKEGIPTTAEDTSLSCMWSHLLVISYCYRYSIRDWPYKPHYYSLKSIKEDELIYFAILIHFSYLYPLILEQSSIISVVFTLWWSKGQPILVTCTQAVMYTRNLKLLTSIFRWIMSILRNYSWLQIAYLNQPLRLCIIDRRDDKMVQGSATSSLNLCGSHLLIMKYFPKLMSLKCHLSLWCIYLILNDIITRFLQFSLDLHSVICFNLSNSCGNRST
jgi:hypothetical protein